MASDSAHDRQQWLVAVAAAGATILGGLIAGGASYVATREANRAVVERDERAERLDAQSAARLIDSELGVIQATLVSAKARKLVGASLAQEMRKLPTTVWAAHQQRLARTVRVKVWGDVSFAYSLLRVLSPTATGLPAGVTIEFFQKMIRTARDGLMEYE
jgi:hypothetical protein